MAGDVGIDERVIVLSPAAEMELDAVAAPIQAARGRVRHHYGPRVIIGEVTNEAEESVRAAFPEGELAAAPEAISDDAQQDLDEIGRMGLNAFAVRQSDEFLQAKAKRPLAGASWDTDEAETPACQSPVEHDSGAQEGPAAATSARMTGSVAVGIVIVSGPGNLAFSNAERINVVAEVQNGLSWLGAQNPSANISWHHDIQPVTITTPANPGATNKEAVWRNPAMIELGFTGDWQGVKDYVNQLRSSMGTDWAYCGFFTKYPLDHFAYASIGGPRLVMDYANDGWGPSNIDRVFAHESGHVFTAPDEYAASNCNCGGSWGWFGAPNANCATCAPGGGVKCIMKSNDWEMCAYTPVHFGWGEGWHEFNNGFNSALWRKSNGKIYFFKDNLYIRYSRVAAGVDIGYPKPIAGNWPDLPAAFQAGIDAALWRESNSKIYLFKGSQYVRYSSVASGVDPGYPKPIAGNWPGLPSTFQAGIDAALWRESNGRIYLFKGDQYVRYSSVSSGVDSGYPKPIAGNWPGMPASFNAGIDGALMRRSNGKIYFFKGDQYLRFSNVSSGVDPGYPKPIAANWPPLW